MHDRVLSFPPPLLVRPACCRVLEPGVLRFQILEAGSSQPPRLIPPSFPVEEVVHLDTNIYEIVTFAINARAKVIFQR
jgi:hypothetical protein